MEIYNLEHEVSVFGFPVKNFPDGIGEAFALLMKTMPDGFERPYYGISYMNKEGQMIYLATALEKEASEAEKYNYERYRIEKGEYLSVTVYDWAEKTSSIKNVFHEIIRDARVDKTKPAIEWYKNDHEMVCMVQTH